MCKVIVLTTAYYLNEVGFVFCSAARNVSWLQFKSEGSLLGGLTLFSRLGYVHSDVASILYF